MSRQRIYRDSYELELVHRQKVTAKYQKIQGLKALLEMWEARRPDQADHDYVLSLRARLRSAENQLAAMKP